MDFKEVMACLEITEKREEFIARLKNAGKNSSAVLHLQSAMTELKMNKTPRGIDQKTIIQHTLRFSDADECFQKFRLVCKLWKDAVETIRLNRVVNEEFFYNLDEKITSQEILPSASYLSKYLKSFRKLHMPLQYLENKNEIYPIVLNNMKKLNEIIFDTGGEDVGEQFGSFAFQMLQNSNETLRTLNIPKFTVPDISFPKLTKLYLLIGENNILLHEFQNCFPKALKNMKNLETVELDLYKPYLPVCQHICENYGKHCISTSYVSATLNNVSAKIGEGIYLLESALSNKKNTSHLEYVHVYILWAETPMRHSWNRYQEFFDQCINLKAIEIGPGNFVTETLPTLSETNQEIWRERISYFQARGIHIAVPNEILGNENLRIKIAKEAEVTWRFHFH